jgi:hypothetical protein
MDQLMRIMEPGLQTLSSEAAVLKNSPNPQLGVSAALIDSGI